MREWHPMRKIITCWMTSGQELFSLMKCWQSARANRLCTISSLIEKKVSQLVWNNSVERKNHISSVIYRVVSTWNLALLCHTDFQQFCRFDILQASRLESFKFLKLWVEMSKNKVYSEKVNVVSNKLIGFLSLIGRFLKSPDQSLHW